ncbi:MAG: PD-(D/E)XK nuclease family protein [Bacteroidota bacterium]
MKKFLTITAEKILAKHGNNLSDVLVLMPNQRSCTYFRNELKRLAQQAVFAPEISTLQNWMLSQSDLVVADNIELITDLHACHKSIGGDLSLDDFMGTANVMLTDFNELDLQMADAKLFFRNLEMLQSMKTYEPGETPTEYKIKYRKFWEEFGLLYQLLRKRLKEKGKGYSGMILREVAEELSSQLTIPVYLIGFSGLNKADEVVIEHLLQTNAQMLWDADEYYVKDEMNEAGFFFRKYLSKFRIDKEQFHKEIAELPKNISVIGAAKNMGQVKVVADILQNKLRLTEKEFLDTVIVVPDEKLLSPLLASLPENISSVNITMGLGMAGTNPATWVEILFRLYENSVKYQSKSGVQRYYYKEIFELLQHNFFRLLFGKLRTDAFIEKMKEQNRILIRKEEISSSFEGKLNSIFFEGNDTKGFAKYLSGIFTALLDTLIKRARGGNTVFASDAEITYRLLNIIQNTQSIFATDESISIKTYIALLRENMHNERVPLEGDPVEGLQIMGLQETRSLDFKNVIILSANEGILTSGKNMSTYIPYEVRREFLNTYKERDAVTAYLFYRLFHKAENVFILFNTEPDELGGGEKSRFILQLEHELKGANSKAEIRDLVFAVDPPSAIGEQLIIIDKNEPVMNKLDDILTKSGISPSALNSYINCTLQYYFRYVAGLREQDDMEENMEAATIGSAVHHALEKIYDVKKGEPISSEQLEEVSKDKSKIEALIREHLSERFDIESLSNGKNLLLYKVCVKLTEEFLKYEIQNLKQLADSGADMQIEMLEEKLSHQLEVNGKQILVSGRVDRIERTGGIIQIADYKTSTKSPIPILNEETWEELMTAPKFSKPVQLLVYAWLYYRANESKNISLRSGIYWLRAAQKKLDTLRVDKENDLIDVPTILKFEVKLKVLLAELTDTAIPFTKTEDIQRCKYCEFANICQRD